jgi:hypothetical protein
MDMGFHMVHTLELVLYPTGFGCIGEDCRSSAHFNGERDRTPHGQVDRVVNGKGGCVKREHWHKSALGALRCEWI